MLLPMDVFHALATSQIMNYENRSTGTQSLSSSDLPYLILPGIMSSALPMSFSLFLLVRRLELVRCLTFHIQMPTDITSIWHSWHGSEMDQEEASAVCQVCPGACSPRFGLHEYCLCSRCVVNHIGIPVIACVLLTKPCLVVLFCLSNLLTAKIAARSSIAAMSGATLSLFED